MAQMELLPRVREMKNFWDRICLRYVLNRLDKSDTQAMIAFRLQQAGYPSRKNLFTAEAIREIYQYTQGYPRKITKLCHDALEQLVISGKDDVDEEVIRTLIRQESQLTEQHVWD